jgi:colanic acid biosynthesis glycosyl transferase WcaI
MLQKLGWALTNHSSRIKVCMLSMTYWPNVPGQGTRHAKVISDLLKDRFDLTVVTRHVFDKNTKSFVVEYDGRTKIVRIPFMRFNKKGFLWRALTNMSFSMACLLAFNHINRHSIIFTVTPEPPYFAVTAPVIRFLKKSRHLALITDLLPDVAYEIGLVKSNLLRRIIKSFCIHAYQNSDCIMVITEALKKRLIDYGIPADRVTVAELAVDTTVFKPQPVAPDFTQVPSIMNKFIVLYSGSFGYMYDFDVVLEAAKATEEFSDKIHFIIRGDGDQRSYISEKIMKLSLRNVTLLGPVSNLDLIISFINIASVCIIPMREGKSVFLTHPSKLFEFWSCQKPIICTSSGETANLINRSKAGIAIPPGDKQAMIDAILYLFNNKQTAYEMGRNGRKLVENEFSYERIREKLTDVIYMMNK